ncbi:MAG: beta-lactamase family protein [Nocardioidaceae bacterium]|nr:beta-lactamase family protein [Nocardioidaceae bacterium]NUS52073.1 beta-lactamase family protein [Nocardioidaceae bacterium]
MDVHGSVDPRFETVREAFAAEVAADADAGCTGSAFAVWHDGAWVVDLWGGYADASHTTPWRRDTIVMPYSVTKPFAALCLLVLVDRGRVDLDAPMTTYWPELAAPATVRQVLCHSAGLSVIERPTTVEAFYDWDLMCGLLAAQPPLWEPGTACGEAALTYGHLVGEVVRRVDGRSPGGFLREEVCAPLGLDFHVGLGDDELRRTAELTGFELAEEEPGSFRDRAISNPPGTRDPAVVNGERWRRAEVPAVNGHGTARAVAGLFVALQEGRLLSVETRDEMLTVAVEGVDRFTGSPEQWALGVGHDEDGFGMGGLGGNLGWWSTAGEYAFAFVTARVADHSRCARVENALRSCLGLPPL